jgi:transcriptional regulator with XRE-family HTH domain
MPKRSREAPFPDSPGAWLACFRHRLKHSDKRPYTPEEMGRLIGCSGATVRRWEAGRAAPDENDIKCLAEVCRLTPLQYTFLTLVFSRVRALPPPPEDMFKTYAKRALCGPYPAIIWDSLLYQRAWSTYIDALAPDATTYLGRGVHPLGLLLRSHAAGYAVAGPDDMSIEDRLRQNMRFFWLGTAHLCHRREYAELVTALRGEPLFDELWTGLVSDTESPVLEPLGFMHAVEREGARFRLNTRIIAFPANYMLWEYVPDDEAAWRRLREAQDKGPPEAIFADRIHWSAGDGLAGTACRPDVSTER